MSWAEEDWTVGLSGRVLQKVKELQVQQERLSRENRQKQLQLDNLNASHEKETMKYEEVRVKLQSTQRELQNVWDEAKATGTICDRLTQELQIKQAQVCSLEGQLDSARTLSTKLTQEVKRLEAELEKLSADTTVYSTPCWNTHSPWEHNSSRKEERVGQQDEGQNRKLHVRQLQFSDMATTSLSQQQHKTTSQLVSSSPLSAFPWERDESRPIAKRRTPSSPQTPLIHVSIQGQSEEGVCEKEVDPRAEADKSLSEIRSRVSFLEEELSVKDTMLKATQGEMVQCKKELAAKEIILQKTQARIRQESERASGAEQRLKQIQEELKCQRQNAESSRLQHQQRIKELEKQHQRDLMESQKERQCLERQHQQEVIKLNQELQQARTLHNALKAQADKLSLQKQMLEKELDILKDKLQWTEKQLQESLKKEAQTQAKLMEAVREAEGVAVSLEQSKKRERALEEEGKRLAEEQADALRLIKELQEQKPATLLQPVQFCSVGQSFSSPPSYSLHSHPSTQTTRSTSASQAEWKRDEDMDERRVETTASYPSDREPGEGIDSEHITVLNALDSESFQKGEHRRRCNEDENNLRNDVNDCEGSGTNKHTPTDRVAPSPSHPAADTTSNTSLSDPAKASDLTKENALLRSELRDLQEELQNRLEDLEAQRRAEAEARTHLKQLSRKRAAQVVEKEEQEKVWRGQLESERAETERLRKAMAALQTEMKKSREEGERKEREETNSILEERESEMKELNIQLKAQLAEVKAQLAMEREEREREQEEEYQRTTELQIESTIKISYLEGKLEEVKRRREEDKASVPNSPLTYLTLHDDELNSNIVYCDDNKHLSSPLQHRLLCQSTHQHNTLVSQLTAEVMQEHQMGPDPERSPLPFEGQAGQMTSDLHDRRKRCLQASPLPDSRTVELAPADLAKELERLETENAKEKERANQYQVKLEALQNQVTCQTRQLTMAFEKQSQHISGLLAELQEKESALVSQGEELQHHRQELDALKAEKEQEEREKSELLTKEVQGGDQTSEEEDGESVEISGLLPSQEKEGAVILAEEDVNAQRGAGRPKTVTSAAETPTPANCGAQHSDTTEKTQSSSDSACVTGENQWSQSGGSADVVAELLALQQENQLLKQRIETMAIPHGDELALSQNQDSSDTQSQNTGTILSYTDGERAESVSQDERRMEGEQQEEGITPQAEEGQLEEQVVALQMQVRALREQTQQQAHELVVWRLASQPAPTFGKVVSDTDNQIQDQLSAVTQSKQRHGDQAQQQLLGPQGGSGKMTVTREDELFLSCSSNKLQGRMVLSRHIQHINFSEPKSLDPYKKTSAPQQHSQDTSDKEEICLLPHPSSPEHTEKSDTGLIHISSDNIHQQHITRDLLEVSEPHRTTAAEGQTGNHWVNLNISQQMSDSSERDFSTETRSVGSQTEDGFSKYSGEVASELHSVYTQTEAEKEDEHIEDSPPVSPAASSEAAEPGDKRLFSSSFPIPADPARLAERIRRNRTQLSAAFDDTEYEPYGLPEVVMKGFADIPTGPSCPYIVRRGLLGTAVVPASQKDSGEEETD